MDDFQSKLSSILENPAMMQQIMSMAQAMNQASPQATSPPSSQAAQPAAEAASSAPPEFPNIDFSMLQKLSGLAASTGVDQNQKVLLQALTPYLSAQRLEKLEKAMRAVKLARFASNSLGQLNFSLFSGR